MPKQTLLYYPNIAIPTDRWLRRVILYWDEVGSIVPRNFVPEKNPEINFLKNEGVYRRFSPRALESDWSIYEAFTNEFMDVLVSDRFQRTLLEKDQRRAVTKIHHEKMLPSVFAVLEQEGLAERGDDYDWYNFELHTARLYMSLLAKYLAFADGTDTFAGTDSPTYRGLSYYPTDKVNVSPGLNVDFFNILPVPVETVSYSDILKFKEIRKDELNDFRKTLNETCRSLMDAESQELYNDILSKFQQGIGPRLSNLKSSLRDSKINFALDSVSILTPAIPSLYQSENKLHVAAAFAISISVIVIKNFLSNAALQRGTEITYLHHAQKAGILSA